MARFLGSASGRTAGSSAAAGGFTKAKVFSTAGTTTFTIPNDATKAKVFVLGAGSSYRTGTYAFCADTCSSGVSYPKSCYCACFTGHLTGAGGGYSEKTYDSTIAGKILTINIGSIGGLSASSVAVTGESTVTGSNATESAYSWSCTDNSTARDASNDNPISLGFSLPVCGYVNTFSGYYNIGGTASGGDVNRTGGSGTLIPEFLQDSYFDGITCTIASGGATGSTGGASCWVNPTITCSCMFGYHTTFGSSCYASAWQGASCTCYYLCAVISGLQHCTSGGSATPYSSRFSFTGRNSKSSSTSSCMFLGAETTGPNSYTNNAGNQFIKDTPIGVGAQSGNSSNNGRNGYSELTLVDTTFSNCCTAIGAAGPGDLICINYNHNGSGYDYSFGGQQYSCYCNSYWPGCHSSTACRGSGTPSAYCYTCMGWTFTYVFGTASSGEAHCFCMPRDFSSCCSSGGGGCCCINRCYNMGFVNDQSLISPSTSYEIALSSLVSDTNTNINDISYGGGAGITTSANFGGGGNRLYPTGGSGVVVVVY
jgi:hypothetical protein